MDEPERARRDDDDRSCEGELPPRGFAPRAQRRERRRHDDDDEQLADLDPDVEREERPAERARRQIHLAQHVGEPEAVDEAERERDPRAHVAAVPDQQVVGADVDDAQRDGRLDDARRRRHDVQRRERQRDAVRDGERRHDHRELADRAAEQQQADEEQQVIGADEDVVDSRGQELLDHRQRALPRAGEVLEARTSGVENRLRQRVAFVHVEEGLVHRIVRKHPGGHRDRSGALRERKAHGKPQRLAIAQDVGREPLRRQRTAVRADRQPRRQQRRQLGRSRERHRRIEEPLRRLHVQIVRRIEDVDDEGAFDRIRLQAEIEITERHRMRGGGARQAQRRDDRDG